MTNNNSFQLSLVRCAALEFDLALGAITNSPEEVQRLSPIHLKLLTYLLKHQGQVVSRTELFDAIWPNQLISDDVLTRAISDIRTQLAKLDADTKFIETLPKRGYRWIVDVFPIADSQVKKPEIEQKEIEPGYQPPIVVDSNSWLKKIVVYLSLAVVLAMILMWGISQSLHSQAISIAVLPAMVDRPSIEPLAQTVDEALLQSLRKNTNVKLLSASAIRSRPQNPFPYFANEFGVVWVIESRVSDLDGINNIELSLVDARTGIELRNLKFDVAGRADIFHKVAQKLESDLLVEYLPY